MSNLSYDAERQVYIDWDRYYDDPEYGQPDDSGITNDELREQLREERELFLGYQQDRM